MKGYYFVISPILVFFLLMGIVSTVYGIDYTMNRGVSIPAYLGMPMMSVDCMSSLQGLTVDLNHIATEHSQIPASWCVEKGRPANEISFKQPYDIINSGVKDWRSVYQIRMTLDEENHVKEIVFYKNSVPVSSIPGGLWDIALQRLDAR